MVYESFAVLIWFVVLGLAGLGPALWLLPRSDKQWFYAVGIAPGLAFAMVRILGLVLVRFVGPVHVWALSFAAALILVSAGLVFLWRRRNSGVMQLPRNARSLALPGGFLVGTFLVLVLPLATRGIQYSIFRANPSDAFTYISLGETVRQVPWTVILRGANFTPENLRGLQELASYAPTALFSARNVGFPLQLNNMIALAWSAEVVGLPTYAAYYPYHLLAFLISFVLVVVVGDQLRLGAPITYVAASVVAWGFWARFVLESDASYEIASIPLLLLFGFSWMQYEEHTPNALFTRTRVLLAVAAAALAVNYLVLVPIVALAFVVYYGVRLLRRERPLRALLYHALTAVYALAILGATAQIDLIYYNLLYFTQNVDRQREFPHLVVEVWSANGLNGVWGMGVDTVLGPQRALVRLPLWIVTNAFALVLTGLVAAAAWFAFLRPRRVPEKIIFSILAACAVFMIWMFISGNLRATGRAFSYGLPFLVVGLASATTFSFGARAWAQRAAVAAVVGWGVLQMGLGIYLPFGNAWVGVFGPKPRPEMYDLTPITRYLDQHPPQMLLVSIPRDKRWDFPYYTTFVFAKYPVYYQSGLLVDNNVTYKNVWLEPLGTAPDYAVISKDHDYIADKQWGEPVAETRDLRLYRVTVADPALWNAAEQEIRAAEAEKPDFVQTIPMLFPTP